MQLFTRLFFTAALPALMLGFAACTDAAASAECAPAENVELPADCESIAVREIVQGAHNFREITLPPEAKRKIKPGVLFRSDSLHALSDADLKALEEKGVRTVVDLRSAEEMVEFPGRHIKGVEARVNLPMGADPNKTENLVTPEQAARIRALYFEGKFDEIDSFAAELGLDIEESRRERYREFAFAFRPQVKRLLQMLADENNYPLVFHCQGGKDRTGFTSAVIMRALGFSREDALRDYLTTNLYEGEELRTRVQKTPESLLPIMGAHSEQLLAALEAIDAEYGGFENYLHDGLGISAAELRAIRNNLLAQ